MQKFLLAHESPTKIRPTESRWMSYGCSNKEKKIGKRTPIDNVYDRPTIVFMVERDSEFDDASPLLPLHTLVWLLPTGLP